MTAPSSRTPQDLLIAAFEAGVAAARPGPAVETALRARGRVSTPPWLLAAGKAAVPMARAATSVLQENGLRPEGGLVIGPEAGSVGGCVGLAGDHPLPGPGSVAAADAVAEFVGRVPPGAQVWLMLSGGATSLMAGPVEGLSLESLRAGFDALHRTGWEIGAMNQVRKRLVRWGGGRLLEALGHARVLQLLVSDVPGDDPAAIGSGPCIADPVRAPEVLAWVRRHEPHGLPAEALAILEAMATGARTDLPDPDQLAELPCETRIVASNLVALDRARVTAERFEVTAVAEAEFLDGEASRAGVRVARHLARVGAAGGPAAVHLWGSETTVERLTGTGRGGRCQELALAAALELERLARGDGPLATAAASVVLLAAGTDGRDGPTDAAGAVVSAATPEAVRRHGVDPMEALAAHDSHPALAAAGALYRSGLTGTNVMDLVLGWVPGPASG